MKYIFPFLFLLLIAACRQPADKQEDNSYLAPLTNKDLSPLQKKVDSALKEIVKIDFSASGDVINSIEIDGMEIIKISQQDYLMSELKDQEMAFKNYEQYLKKFPKEANPLNSPQQMESSKAKHDAVVSYLSKTIKTASTNPEWYKVLYFLKLQTNKNNFTQAQTTYLDEQFNKKVMNYGFLNK